MKKVLVALAIFFCSAPIAAEESSTADAQFDAQPITFRIELRGSEALGSFFTSYSYVRIAYLNGKAEYVDMNFAMSPGASCLDDAWQFGLRCIPDEWKYGERLSRTEKPLRPAEFYLTVRYISHQLDARLFYPLAYQTDGHVYHPSIEVEKATIANVGPTKIILRGRWSQQQGCDFKFGAIRTVRPNLELGFFSDGSFCVALESSTEL